MSFPFCLYIPATERPMSEKRKYMRFNVFMDAVCRRGALVDKLKVSNFSREGMGILSRKPFKQGEHVDIELKIPGDDLPVLLQGEIAWAKDPVTDNSQYKSGIRFKDLNNGDRSRILEFIYHKWIMPAEFGVN